MLQINFVHHIAHDTSKKFPLNHGEEFVIGFPQFRRAHWIFCLFSIFFCVWPSISPQHKEWHAVSFKKWFALARITTGDFLIQPDTKARFLWNVNEPILNHWLG